MRLLSVNIGRPQLNPWKTMKLTGIDKRPVDGPVMVTRPRAKGMGMVGLAGDRVYDVREHGGPDRAVYAYAREDLDFWAAQLGRTLPNGLFGENLTTEDADANGALIGERWRIGPDLILEASAPRIPCGTFQGWLAQAAGSSGSRWPPCPGPTSGWSSRAKSRPATRSRSCTGPSTTSASRCRSAR
jgi:MOSC domain-containing protein YiiM